MWYEHWSAYDVENTIHQHISREPILHTFLLFLLQMAHDERDKYLPESEQ